MRSVILLLLLSATARAQTNIPIYVHIVSHNEENMVYITSSNYFALQRTLVVTFANMLKSNNVMYNWQSDWTFLTSVTNWDHGTESTAGTNLVVWLRDVMGFEVDPHAHQTKYNYADVAEMIRRCGIVPSGVVGGAIVWPYSTSIYDQVSSTITGSVFPSVTWTPQVIWGGGSLNHIHDTNTFVSGLRRVRDREHYLEHSPTGRIIALGTYGNADYRWTNLEQLISLRSQELLCTNKMYTCLIMVSQGDLSSSFITDFETTLKSFTNTPNLRWLGISQIVSTWQTDYNSEPNIFPYYFDRDMDGDGLNDGWEVTNNCDLSWSDGSGDVDSDAMSELAEYVTDTEPTNASSYFAVSAGSSNISWYGALGRIYSVESATNFMDAWTNTFTVIGTGGISTFTGAPANVFHRVRASW